MNLFSLAHIQRTKHFWPFPVLLLLLSTTSQDHTRKCCSNDKNPQCRKKYGCNKCYIIMVVDASDNSQGNINSFITKTLQSNSFTLVCKTKRQQKQDVKLINALITQSWRQYIKTSLYSGYGYEIFKLQIIRNCAFFQ